MSDEGLPGAKRAGEQSERFRAAIDKIRERTDLAAKGLVAVGTAAVSGIGYAKLADVFPLPTSLGGLLALLLLIAGLGLMVYVVIKLFHRFNDASKTVVTTSSPARTIELNGIQSADERKLITDAYQKTADLNETRSLPAYEARGLRLERVAANVNDDALSKKLNAQADQILTEVRATQDRAAAFVLRRRANEALFGGATVVWIVLFVIGWYATALGSDGLHSEREGKTAVAKACADARAVASIVEDELPDICGELEPKEATTARKIARESFAALASALDSCLAAVEEQAESSSDCAPIERALESSLDGQVTARSASDPQDEAGSPPAGH
jgi:hypothetical protein